MVYTVHKSATIAIFQKNDENVDFCTNYTTDCMEIEWDSGFVITKLSLKEKGLTAKENPCHSNQKEINTFSITIHTYCRQSKIRQT